MKKNIISFCLLLILIGCATTRKEDKIIITGKFSWNEWQKQAGWEIYTATDYQPGQFLADQISEIYKSGDIKFLLFAGSWCGDSKSELPKIYKLIDLTGIGEDKIELYGVDRAKREPTGMAENYKIEKVPTLIILRKGHEIGRILEYPQTSWEEDIFKILLSEQ